MDSTLKQMCEYIVWSEKILIDLLKEVKDEDFSKIHPEFGRSMKNLANHIWLSYKGYFYGFTSAEYSEIEKKSQDFSMEELFRTWIEVIDEFTHAIQKEQGTVQFPISPEKEIEISTVSNLMQYTDHASYHRGQLISLLTIAGYEVKSTDFYLFLTTYLKQ